MASNASDRYWWQRLGQSLPLSVVERVIWYERQVRRKRTAYYVVELVILLASAAIPAAAAVGASTAVLGVLGAVLTALIGSRQLFKLEQDWIRFSRT
jgi:membrane associated rhomboid family serine protease